MWKFFFFSFFGRSFIRNINLKKTVAFAWKRAITNKSKNSISFDSKRFAIFKSILFTRVIGAFCIITSFHCTGFVRVCARWAALYCTMFVPVFSLVWLSRLHLSVRIRAHHVIFVSLPNQPIVNKWMYGIGKQVNEEINRIETMRFFLVFQTQRKQKSNNH